VYPGRSAARVLGGLRDGGRAGPQHRTLYVASAQQGQAARTPPVKGQDA
jgi:hypothetical protein